MVSLVRDFCKSSEVLSTSHFHASRDGFAILLPCEGEREMGGKQFESSFVVVHVRFWRSYSVEARGDDRAN